MRLAPADRALLGVIGLLLVSAAVVRPAWPRLDDHLVQCQRTDEAFERADAADPWGTPWILAPGPGGLVLPMEAPGPDGRTVSIGSYWVVDSAGPDQVAGSADDLRVGAVWRGDPKYLRPGALEGTRVMRERYTFRRWLWPVERAPVPFVVLAVALGLARLASGALPRGVTKTRRLAVASFLALFPAAALSFALFSCDLLAPLQSATTFVVLPSQVAALGSIFVSLALLVFAHREWSAPEAGEAPAGPAPREDRLE